MSDKDINQLPDQVMYRHLRERYSLVNDMMLKNSFHPSLERVVETPPLKKEVADIIFKSAHIVNQLKQKVNKR